MFQYDPQKHRCTEPADEDLIAIYPPACRVADLQPLSVCTRPHNEHLTKRLLYREQRQWRVGIRAISVQLTSSLGADVAIEPRRFNYLLHLEDPYSPIGCETFIPIEAIWLASDKRLLADAFTAHGVPTPETYLLHTFPEVVRHVCQHSGIEWCLKYSTGCVASGHRLITGASDEPPNWPRPFIVQEFIRMERPEVNRMYCATGEMFGWIVRRFPEGARTSPWVAHARGARYVRLVPSPSEALEVARRGFQKT
jgi:hypothetical protein